MKLVFFSLCSLLIVGANIPPFVQQEISRCGNPIDAHLHLEGQWFTEPQPLLAEMTAAGVEQGVLIGVYGPVDALGIDPMEGVRFFVENSGGRLFGLASLNTTGDWGVTRDRELNRLKTYLEMDGFVGSKLAPPHTRLPLNSTIMGDILAVVAQSTKPILGIHMGTTPFCGPFGDAILGQRGLCTEEYVDPFVFRNYIALYPNITFILMHGGQDFGGATDAFPYYDGVNFDHTIDLMQIYDNIYVDISAMLATDQAGNFRNPLALENLHKIFVASLQSRALYGSDRNQFPGGLTAYLFGTISILLDANLTEEERCAILVDNPRSVYNIPAVPSTAPSIAPSLTTAPSMATTEAPSSAAWTTSWSLLLLVGAFMWTTIMMS